MNKRSAVLVASGLVLTLIVGGFAVAVGLTGPSVSSAVPHAEQRSAEPLVRTVRRTVTVHQTADPKPAEVVQIPASSTASGSIPEDSSGSDDGTGEDSHEDDDHGEDHGEDGGEDGGGEDHDDGSGEDHGDDD